MRVIRFPTPGDGPLRDEDGGAAIDAALNGETAGAEADALRELRADVRSLAAPLDPEFERELQARVAEWGAQGRRPRRSLNARLTRLRVSVTASAARSLAAGGAVVALVALVVTLLVAGSGRNATFSSSESKSGISAPAQQDSRRSTPASSELAPASKHGAKVKADAEPAGGTASSAAGPDEIHDFARSLPAPGRLQQLGASVSLATSSTGVQQVSDSVTRLAVGDGGYVESSHVQVRQGGPSEAQLHLSIPSAKLSAVIATLGRIAPVRAVNQESQDITGSYDNARRRLSDDETVRRALLRALAAATTEGRIDSLRERLSSNREALSRDRAQLHSVTHTAATSQLEVTIAGNGSAAAHRSTLGRGLDDAGHVLAVAAAAALIGLAVLVPLVLFALALDALRRIWRRRRREAALDS